MIKLEAAARPKEDSIKLIVRRIIRGDSGEVVRAIIGDQLVSRKANESEGDFIARSTVEGLACAPGRLGRVILLSEQDVNL
ncbi:hypothetical protein [Candidatus Accumulibacter sp. ACC012]|uniref:hypothetical protein n=1 Tax=Candidatus Accumulibacter sp. ACC012 TaxID=2823332 RepID=UPI0025C3DB99|nr:hypothetical protein [Candidatus Accumulibacter sp. ACC012]